MRLTSIIRRRQETPGQDPVEGQVLKRLCVQSVEVCILPVRDKIAELVGRSDGVDPSRRLAQDELVVRRVVSEKRSVYLLLLLWRELESRHFEVEC